MALYTPDFDYDNGRELLEKLPNKEGEQIRLYVASKDREINKLEKRLGEMQEVFNGIKRFTK